MFEQEMIVATLQAMQDQLIKHIDRLNVQMSHCTARRQWLEAHEVLQEISYTSETGDMLAGVQLTTEDPHVTRQDFYLVVRAVLERAPAALKAFILQPEEITVNDPADQAT